VLSQKKFTQGTPVETVSLISPGSMSVEKQYDMTASHPDAAICSLSFCDATARAAVE
jgi:hypothetical protein